MKAKVIAEEIIDVSNIGWICRFCGNAPCLVTNGTTIAPPGCVVNKSEIISVEWERIQIME